MHTQTNKFIPLDVCTVLAFIQAFVHIEAHHLTQTHIRTAALTFHTLPILSQSLIQSVSIWLHRPDTKLNASLLILYIDFATANHTHTATETRTYSHTYTVRAAFGKLVCTSCRTILISL